MGDGAAPEVRLRLAGRVALVTGATRGVGRATAEALLAAGARVALLHHAELPDEIRALVEAARPGACAVRADVARADEVAAALVAAEAALGPIELLVNNAGITRDRLLYWMDERDFTEVLDVDLTGAFRVTREVARGMIRRRQGRIVNVASVSAIRGLAGQAAYAAAKAGLVGMTRALAVELARFGVTVNAVAPGLVDTGMVAGLPPARRRELLGRVPAGRLARPAEVAAATLFLLSEEAAYLTGQLLVVDGGLTA